MKTPRLIQTLSRRVLLACVPLLIPFSVIADETEIFFQGDAASVNANVLFILDSSGSMSQSLSDSGGKSRMQVMKEAFRQVMGETPANVNVGLMHYANATNHVGYDWDSIKGVNFPVSPADQDASDIIGSFASSDNISASTVVNGTELKVAEFLADVVDTWQADGYTPIVDSLYEAARYFRGEDVVWGKYPPPYHWAAHPSTYTGNLSCDNPSLQSCIRNWGRCNGSELESSCVDGVKNNVCCNWISNSSSNGDSPSGGHCEHGNYSCTAPINTCQHEVCDNILGDAVYNTPIEEVCQANYLVLMSDGKPEYPYRKAQSIDGTARYPESSYPDETYNNSIIPELTPEIDSTLLTDTIPDMIGGSCADSPRGYPSGTCGPELTQFLATNDQNADLDGEQIVETYTVAFGLGDEPTGTQYLEDLATAENGAFTANNADELVDAFKNVLNSIEKKSFSFSSPSFSVSEDSLLSHGSDVYVPVMDVGRTTVWSGNLRKFTLNGDGDIVNKNGSTKALTQTGDFADDAQGEWSNAAHGQQVKQGGAANKLPSPASRALYTDATSNALVALHTSSNVAALPKGLFSRGTYKTEHQLKDWVNGLNGESIWGWYIDCNGNKQKVRPWAGNNVIQGPVDIDAVTTCVEDPITIAKRDTLINFARGYVDGVATGANVEVRNHLGDMLNTKPMVVNYRNASTKAVTETLVLITTNEGYLHAIDADTGVEKWGFMPASLLSNQQTFLSNSSSHKHVYGIDGPMTLWQFKDANDNDKKYLFFSLRRGGNMIYAVDISVPSTPKVVWKIDPAGKRGGISSGFSDLGETWSKPTLSRMRDPSDSTKMIHVLVFGGGYDPRMDESDPADRGMGDYKGSDVYIVNALTGAKIWSLKGSSVTGASNLTDSVPGDIRVLDMDNDGGLDRLYFADTGGHIWRVDMSNSVSGSGATATVSLSAQLTKFADLGAVGGGETDRRKFFYEPDTALRLADGVPVLTVSIGSGYRTHPLDKGDKDRFYVLLDENVYQAPPTGFATITESSLMSVTDLRASTEGNILQVANKKGWYYPMPHNGEKVLATSLTFLDKVIFTTFAMADENGDPSVTESCEPAVNTSRAYILDLLTGQPVANLDRKSVTTGSGASAVTTTTKDDFLVAGFNEILDSPQLIFSQLTDGSGGQCTQSSCQQSVSVRVGKLDIPVLDTGNSNTDGDSHGGSVDLTNLLPRLYWRDNDVPASKPLEGVDSAP